ncbi:MAG: hypothetical protein JO340_20120 [Acidobacteriaceae bacterium]|nr:hypothetical protein [Acidobacteriaceae bacterium]
MELADRSPLASSGLVTLVIYPRPTPAAAPKERAEKPGRPGVPWRLALSVFVLAAAITFAAVYGHELWSGNGSTLPPILRGARAAQNLGLRVQYQGERLLVTWSRTSPDVRGATEGVLRIDDGTAHREVWMDASQVTAGSVLYKPASDDVIFRLQVESGTAKPTIETIRVLGAAQAPNPRGAPATSAPAPATSPAASPS